MNEAEIKNMTDDQVWEHVSDCVSTLKILSDKGSDKFEAIHKEFLADVKLLHKLGRIDDDTYNELNEAEILRF